MFTQVLLHKKTIADQKKTGELQKPHQSLSYNMLKPGREVFGSENIRENDWRINN